MDHLGPWRNIFLRKVQKEMGVEEGDTEKSLRKEVCVSIDRAPPHREEEGFILCLKELCLFDRGE